MKCEACDGTGEIDHCAKCGKRFTPSDARVMLADKARDYRERWFGPFCTGCVGIELDQFRESPPGERPTDPPPGE